MEHDVDRVADDLPESHEDGWTHLREGRWEAARAAFQESLTQEESADALEGLSWSAWWLDDAEAVFEARGRAFRMYRERGLDVAAARMAIWLAVDHLDFHGALPVARGWLGRAGRLLEGAGAVPERGWLAFNEGYLARVEGDLNEAAALARTTAESGRDLHVPDLEMLGLGLHGAILVDRGEVGRGMALLDEATAAATAGEARLPIASAWTCCFLVTACEQVRDYPRALEWCGRIESFGRRYGSRYMLGFCRTHYGWIYMMAGRWPEAEAALEGALEAYARSRPAYLPEALAALAELRRRQGRTEEAERLLDEAGPSGQTLLCRARLALDRGEALRSAELVERRIRRLSSDRSLDRAPALALLVRAHATRGDGAQAAEALKELRQTVSALDSPLLQATTDFAAAVLAAASGDAAAARPLLEDAIDSFRLCGVPFEAGRARIELARVLSSLDREDAARREAGLARQTLQELGAETEARRAKRVLDALDRRTAQPPPLPELTPREREVLREVAAGLTNREVGRRLHISEHTVHRHVANILRKLDVPSRAAAASRAAGAGLLDRPGD